MEIDPFEYGYAVAQNGCDEARLSMQAVAGPRRCLNWGRFASGEARCGPSELQPAAVADERSQVFDPLS